MYEYRFPDIGEGITEGEIVKWKVKEGDVIKEHNIIAEIETDKAVAEMPSPVGGTVLKLHFKEGDTVKVGEIIITIGENSEKGVVEIKKPQPKKVRVSEKGSAVVGELEEANDVSPSEIEHKIEKKSADRHLATPAIRKLAKELNVDIDSITGTGKDGRVTEEDIRNSKKEVVSEPKIQNNIPVSESRSSSEIRVQKKYDMFGYIEHVPLKGIRKATAEHMAKSMYTAPHVTHMDEADVSLLVEHREREKENAKKHGIHLTYLPFVIKAVIASMKEHPYLNSIMDDENQEIIIKKYFNIGFAVDVEDGLLVPVIKGADSKSILQIAKEIDDLANKAKERKLGLMDMKGGTFTITNIGSIGGLHATPIINWPEVAILALGKIYQKPIVVNNKIEIRWVMPLSLAFDHRVIDGAEAARFVTKIKAYLEDIDLLFI